MKQLIAAVFLILSTTAHSAAWITENKMGGFIVLTEQPCPVEEWKEIYQYKLVLTRDKSVHFTETDPSKIVLGCYTIPSGDAPIAGMYPIVSLIVKDPFSGEVFKDEHPLPIYEPIPELRVER